MFYSVLIFLHFVIAFLLILFILLQKGDGAGLTGAKPGLEVEENRTKPVAFVTMLLAVLFMCTSVILSIFSAVNRRVDITDEISSVQTVSTEAMVQKKR